MKQGRGRARADLSLCASNLDQLREELEPPVTEPHARLAQDSEKLSGRPRGSCNLTLMWPPGDH